MDLMSIATGVAGIVVKGAKFLNDTKVSDDWFIRAYYFEVTKNIEILKLIDFDKINEMEITSTSFRSLINSLDIEIGSALLCTNEEYRKNIVSFLKEGLRIQAPQKPSWYMIIFSRLWLSFLLSFYYLNFQLLERSADRMQNVLSF